MQSTIAQSPFVTYSNAGIYSACLQCNSLPSSCVVCANITVPGTYTASTVGIEPNISTNDLTTIYPNPTSYNFIIESSTRAKQIAQIYDVNGRLLLRQVINGKTPIDVSELNEGVYTICISTDEVVINKKIVILR